jgi:ribonucleoside-diphosphate reductase alpha chain
MTDREGEREGPWLEGISREVWEMKYRCACDEEGRGDGDISGTWRRVARAAAKVEARDQAGWEERFLGILRDFRFIPGGRILAGAGTGRQVTLFNCFVMGTIEDSIAGIFDVLKESALTMQAGGGIGVDFSPIRPKGAPVRNIAAEASGPLSFMDVWDAMCRTIMSAGHRRGAMMGVLACDHPDIEAFIDAKKSPGRLTNFNLSVLVTDAFMEAVLEDADWPLKFGDRVVRTVKARQLWERLMRATYDHAEPGVIFIDRVNEKNNLAYIEEIRATNPCGEQPLPPYGACLLGSLNLVKFVQAPFSEKARLNEAELARVARVAVRLLDNVIDISYYPLPPQRAEAMAKRRVGLGITGLADALAMVGVRYGTEEAAALAGRWMAVIERAAYEASTELAAEKGSFPLFDADAYLCSGHVQDLPADIRLRIREKGIRNALLTSVAPTGTISLLAGNVSSGIEPIFALEYTRRMRQPDGSWKSETVTDWAVRLWRRLKGEEAPLPDVFVTAQELGWREHLRMQAAVQQHVDSAISKTVNLPRDISFDEFRDVYLEAWRMGLKGCTTYRPNPVTGSVLSVDARDAQEDAGRKADSGSASGPVTMNGAQTRGEPPAGEICPRCGEPTVRHAEGCALCLTCDHSRCA